MAETKHHPADDSMETTEKGKQHYRNRAKKLKRSKFLPNAKRFGKRNSFGRGFELEQAEYNYLVSILEAMTKQKDTEERQLIANNVMGQLKGKEIRTASNQVGSRVLENLLVYTGEETFAPLMDMFAENFRVFCCDIFASHVLQKMLHIAMLRAVAPLQPEKDEQESQQQSKKKKPGSADWNENSVWPCVEYSMKEEYSDEHRQKCRQFVERMAKFLVNNMEEFVWDMKANFVIRQCMLNLSGITEKKAVEGSESKPLTVPEQWQKLLHEFSVHLMSWPQFGDLAHTDLTAVMLQDLLRAVEVTGDAIQLEQLVSKLYKEVFRVKKKDKKEELNQDEQPDEQDLPKVFINESIVRLLEVCIVVAPAQFVKDKIFARLFRGHVKQLALSRACNFAVQKLIDRTSDKDMMDLIFGELEESFEKLLHVGHTGVLLTVAKACVRLSCQQGKFVKLFLDALHCDEVAPEKMIMAFLYLIPVDVTPLNTPKIHLHGSLILQAILDFNKPIKFVTALLGISNDRLAEILIDPRGSFIANAFVQGRSVGEKSREKLVRHLEGQYCHLALTVHGSRVVEIMYEAGNAAQRENIVRELAEQCAQLNNKPWGAMINKRLLVDTYKRDPVRWRVAIKNDAKVGKMFSKLMDGKKRKIES
ncbi:nucleolar protein 9 [Anopheles moucheti]|uniref:nucleolar protein 9 n=1 Tax=Anopheles moucheti TaxID=186751 RepID=UPI0022F03BB5|nr:nucleolar protein 9 [Anopheles moucheti]